MGAGSDAGNGVAPQDHEIPRLGVPPRSPITLYFIVQSRPLRFRIGMFMVWVPTTAGDTHPLRSRNHDPPPHDPSGLEACMGHLVRGS